MNTIAHAWQEFERNVIGAEIGPEARDELRATFYAGAASILWIGVKIADFSQPAAVMVWQSLHDESAAYISARLADQNANAERAAPGARRPARAS